MANRFPKYKCHAKTYTSASLLIICYCVIIIPSSLVTQMNSFSQSLFLYSMITMNASILSLPRSIYFNNNYFSLGIWWYYKLWDENRLLLRPFCTWYQNIKKYHYWIDIDDNELNISIMHEFLFDKKALTSSEILQKCTRMSRTI